jgi:hypothetical protein
MQEFVQYVETRCHDNWRSAIKQKEQENYIYSTHS